MIAYPSRVALAEDPEDLAPAFDDGLARLDDAHWAGFVRRPLAAGSFLVWWVARRWVKPRDPRRWEDTDYQGVTL